MRQLRFTDARALPLLLLLTSLVAQSACSPLAASTSSDSQDRVLTNMSCRDPFMLKLITVSKQWYIELRGTRYRLKQAGDALRPIMGARQSKAVLVLAPRDVRYEVLQRFAGYARSAGVTCINWEPKL